MSAPCTSDMRLLVALYIAHLKALPRPLGAALPTIRRIAAIPLLITFAGGSAFMWYGSLHSLIVSGGFNGITCWQGMGIFYLVYVNHLTWKRLKEKSATGKGYEVKGAMRKRLWAAWWIVTMNILANIAAIWLIVDNLSHGRLKWTAWDTRAFAAAGAVALLVVLVGAVTKKNMLKSQPAVFILVVVTRIIPQSFLGLSDNLAIIDWTVLVGLEAIAGQRFLISLIEIAEAYREKKSKENRARAVWVGLGDLCNLGAAMIPMILKAVRF